MSPSVACKQECGHTHCRCVSCAGHSSQAADLAVHLPAADLRGTGTLQEQDRPLPGLQECRLAMGLLLMSGVFCPDCILTVHVYYRRTRDRSRNPPTEQLHASVRYLSQKHCEREKLRRLHYRHSPGNG